MHRGCGYLQNYVNGVNMPGSSGHLRRTYAPVFEGRGTRLYVARQWRRRSPERERALLRTGCVSGLVFSSFRHDNPGPIRRNDWRA